MKRKQTYLKLKTRLIKLQILTNKRNIRRKTYKAKIKSLEEDEYLNIYGRRLYEMNQNDYDSFAQYQDAQNQIIIRAITNK